MSRKEFFEKVDFKGKESKSGPGSEGRYALDKYSFLQDIVRRNKITSVLDIGCGDLYWMRTLLSDLRDYHGVDISEPLIEENRKKFGKPGVTFECTDVINRDEWRRHGGRYELVVCLEVALHLLRSEIPTLLEYIFYHVQPKYFWVLRKHDIGTEDNRWTNVDLTSFHKFQQRAPNAKEMRQTDYGNYILYQLQGKEWI